MAYAPNTAFDNAKTYIRKMPLQDVQYQILDDANKLIWMADSWRWTIGSLPNFNLTSNTQDYTATEPADFLYTTKAYVTDGNKSQPLRVEPAISTTEVLTGGWPEMISRSGTNTFRVFPKVGSLATGDVVTVVQLYKKTAPLIDVSNAATGGALVMPDEWFHVYFAAVLYYAYLYANDSHAGGPQYNASSKETIYVGQLGVVMSMIEGMRAREPMHTEWDFRPDPPAKRK